jgi:Beta-ketoacyl synthase, N-terminal domain
LTKEIFIYSWTARDEPAELRPLTDQAVDMARLLVHDLPDQTRREMGLFIGSTTGSLEDDRIFQRSRRAQAGRYASPAAFRRTLPSTVPAELSIALGICGPLLVFAAGESSGLLAIIRAVQWIKAGRIFLALAGMLDWYGPDIAPDKQKSGSCRTLMCLIGSAATLHSRTPQIKITKVELAASAFKMAGIQDQSFPLLLESLQKLEGESSLELESETGTLCRLVLQRG